MSIGIIGSGALGSNLARIFAKAGIAATISNSRGPDSLSAFVEEVGPSITAGTVDEAAAADIVIVAVRWVDAGKVLTSLPAWNGRIVIDGTNPLAFFDPSSPDAQDPTNPLAAYGVKAIDLGDKYSTGIIEEYVPGARVVKAFNHIEASLFREPQVAGGQRVLFYSGNDAGAKGEIRALIEATGFFPIDLGSQEVGGRLATLPFGPLSSVNLIKI
jgi:predicted dinucleotide-binding enzyme